MASTIKNEIGYGNPIWRTNSAEAMSEARSRIEAAKNTDWNGQPPALYFYDLNALEALPQELAEIPWLERVHILVDPPSSICVARGSRNSPRCPDCIA